MISFFFFKQKTAYEMRISDWSSDVCSSDLIAAELGLPYTFAQFINQEAGARAMEVYRRRFRPSQWCEEPRASVGLSALCAPTAEEAVRLSWSQIGRASCRESVCQYV